MIRRFVKIIIAAALLASTDIQAFAESAAFGFFTNESGNESLDYLEKILPNSFAGALKNKHKFDTIKPGQIKSLSAENNNGLKREIKAEELPSLTEETGTDYFIYGTFKPVENNRIILNVYVYKKGTSSIFQFEDTGYLETEIFKLVDKIAVQIKNIANDFMVYKNDTVSSKSKIAIITNIDGDELNSLYYRFLTSGYRLSPTQGNDLYGIIDHEQIKKFYHISGVNASFQKIHNRKEVELLYGTWSGVDYYQKVLDEKKAFDKYSFRFLQTKNELIKNIRSFGDDSFDYLVIIGFDEDRTNAWIRCLNMKDNRLIITESGISGSSIDEIAKNIITSITTGLPGSVK